VGAEAEEVAGLLFSTNQGSKRLAEIRKKARFGVEPTLQRSPVAKCFRGIVPRVGQNAPGRQKSKKVAPQD
jgi:hypothetical protein